MNCRKSLLRSLALLLVLNTVGCGTTPATLSPVMKNSRVKVESAQSEHIRQDVDGVEAIGRNAGNGVMVGAAGGAYVGTGCGPFFIICSPIFAVVGGAAGLIGGGVYGGVVALPEEKEKQFNEILLASFATAPPSLQLEETFRNSVGNSWQLTDSSPQMIISLKLDRFEMSQHSKDRVAIRLDASFVVTYPEQENRSTRSHEFHYQSNRYHVDYFLANEGEKFREEFRLGISTLAKQMASTLMWPAPASTLREPEPASDRNNSPGFWQSASESNVQ